MIDDVILKCLIEPPPQVYERSREPFEYMGFVFDPYYRHGIVNKYISNFKNLRLVLKDDILLIYGSWHKFYHGENHGDYTWQQIGETINELSENFGKTFLDAEITKLTIGCNINFAAKQILSKIKGIRGKSPSDMLGGINHQSYGKYYKMTHFRYKIYDKQFEVKYHDKKKIGSVIRLEKEIMMKAARKRAKNPLDIVRPLDLLESRFLKICFSEMEELMESIEFQNTISLDAFEKASDLVIYQLMMDLDVRLAYKKIANPKTFRSKFKRFLELEQIYSNEELDPFDFISTEVRKKMCKLGSVSTLRKTG